MKLEHLGPTLRYLRERRLWKQQQLACRAGMMPAMVSAYETGKRLPSLRTLSRLLDSLGADLRHLHGALRAVQEAEELSRDLPSS
jgi:transcriptional regulator with XRE-family HTH domain